MQDCHICEKDCDIHAQCANCNSTCETKPEMLVNGKYYCCTSERDAEIAKLEADSPKS